MVIPSTKAFEGVSDEGDPFAAFMIHDVTFLHVLRDSDGYHAVDNNGDRHSETLGGALGLA